MRADKNLKTSSVGVNFAFFYATPLITAIASNNRFAIKLLIDQKADPNIGNSNGDLPIDYAINQHDPSTLSLLISNGAIVKYNSIRYSIEMNDFECTKILFSAIQKTQPEKLVQYTTDAQKFLEKCPKNHSIDLLLALSPEFCSGDILDFNNFCQSRVLNDLQSTNESISHFLDSKKKNNDSILEYLNLLYNSNHLLYLFLQHIDEQSTLYMEQQGQKQHNEESTESEKGDIIAGHIIGLWMQKLKETNDTINRIQSQVGTNGGVDAVDKWYKVIKKRKEFIESLLNRGIEEAMMKNEVKEEKKHLNQLLNGIYSILTNADALTIFEKSQKTCKSFLKLINEYSNDNQEIFQKIENELPLIEGLITELYEKRIKKLTLYIKPLPIKPSSSSVPVEAPGESQDEKLPQTISEHRDEGVTITSQKSSKLSSRRSPQMARAYARSSPNLSTNPESTPRDVHAKKDAVPSESKS